MKKAVSLILCILMVLTVFVTPCMCGIVSYAEGEENDAVVTVDKGISYDEYINSFKDKENTALAETISVNALNYIKTDEENVPVLVDEDTALVVDEGNVYEWEFSVAAAGFYNIALDVRAVEDARNDIVYDALIDDQELFDELSIMEISRRWVDETDEEVFDSNGNQIRSQIIQDFSWHTEYFKSSEGLYSDYFQFYFTEGTHKITLKGNSGKFAVREISVIPYSELPTYKEFLKENSSQKKYDGKTVVIEAEKMKWRSSVSILALTDMQSPYTNPYSASKTLLNTVGGSNWKYAWDTVAWNVNVPADGLYCISIRYRQNYLSGMNVYRSMSVNGSVPYKEANSLSFGYGDDWQVNDLENFYVKLNKGDNEICLSVTMSEMAASVRELQDILLNLNNTYRDILMIVGATPDANRDYELDEQLPNLKKELNTSAKRIEKVVESFSKEGGAVGKELSVLSAFVIQLKEIAKKTYTLTRDGRLTGMKSNISSMGAFISTLREQALEIDSIYVGSEDMKKQESSAKFFDSIKHKTLRFIASFTEDYSGMSSGNDEAITVWLQSLGRDQMQILKNMIDDDFTPKTGIAVDLKLVTSSIVHADFAGRAPDVALNNVVSTPVNYALRGISTDLSCMEDFDEVIKGFSPDSMKSYEYDGKYYGIPEKQTFSMMFYRTDILSELGVAIPQTWNQLVKETLPVLRRDNLEIGIGALSGIQDMTGYNIFTTLLYQNGGKIYEDDLLTSALDSVAAFESFAKAISYYTDYKFPQSYDGLNRFRSGEMPILISDYVFYNNLAVGAPEISGLWDMTLIPGTEKEDGTIDRSQIFSSTASIILETSKKKESSWKFLRWWSSAEIMARYGLELEAVLGAAGRYAPANIEATAALPWSSKQLNVLEQQRQECISLEQMPGSYFTSKAINNAFLTCVLNSDKLPREEIIYWSEQIDLELERKRKEFDY